MRHPQIWGHMHGANSTVQKSAGNSQYDIFQPGSTVATSWAKGDSLTPVLGGIGGFLLSVSTPL